MGDKMNIRPQDFAELGMFYSRFEYAKRVTKGLFANKCIELEQSLNWYIRKDRYSKLIANKPFSNYTVHNPFGIPRSWTDHLNELYLSGEESYDSVLFKYQDKLLFGRICK